MPLSDEQRQALILTEDGLVPAIVQDAETRAVLMFAWMDIAALDATLETGEAVFWSRSRQEQWHKGATSGNTLRVTDVHVDCDGDVLLVTVDAGDHVACHTGERTCFHRTLNDLGSR